MTRADEFITLIETETNECLMWPHSSRNGYGQLVYEGKLWRANRLALTLSVGPPPDDDHDAAHGSCHERACANYRHLRWLTRRENIHDKFRDGTASPTRTAPEHVLAIRDAAARGESLTSIARRFNMTPQNVGLITRRITWRHL